MLCISIEAALSPASAATWVHMAKESAQEADRRYYG